MIIHNRPISFLRWPVAAVLLLIAGAALAAAGKVLFVSGEAHVERNGGKALAKGDPIEVGDVVVTGANARVQLLMADGGKIALRAGSRFRLDALTMPSTVTAPGQATATAKDGSSIATLLKGGFRTSTGSIGKTDPVAYEVRTPVGVLGIRGTDYTAVFCAGDCSDAPGVRPGEAIREGLYLGVTAGGIVFRPTGGTPINVEAGQFIFIPTGNPIPETLPAEPPVLKADGAGTLEIAGLPRTQIQQGVPGNEGSISDFGNRRGPPEDGGQTPPTGVPGTEPSINQPIEGTDGQGRPVDITGGVLPGIRNLAIAAAQLGQNSSVASASQALASGISTDPAGDLTRFPAAITIGDTPVAASIGIGTSANTNTGADGALGLRWGRWSGGAGTISANGTAAGSLNLSQQSLHWILEDFRSDMGVLPVAGTADYTVIGNTDPTDDAGNVGTLGAAFLTANFTNQTVDLSMVLDVAQATWFMAGTGNLTPTDNTFGGFSTSADIGGVAPVFGSFSGLFTQTADGSPGAPGAGASYALVDAQGGRGTVSGVLGFAPGIGQPLSPLHARRDVSFAIGSLGQAPYFSAVAGDQPADYTVNAALNVTSFTASFPSAAVPITAIYQQGTSVLAESNYDSVTLLRWGRWSGGQAQAVILGAPQPVDLANRSLHWVVSANEATPPTIPQTGSVSYTLAGNTAPTNRTGAVGTLGSATFTADFTNSTVTSALDLTVNNLNWTANGTGPIGAQASLPAHQFAGGYIVSGTDLGSGQPFGGTGVFSGFFSAAGGTTPGVPGGAALTYSITDDLGADDVQGAVVFHSP